MAFGNKNRESNLVLYILKIKSKDENGKDCAPYFQISRKVDGKWEVTDQKEYSVTGTLFKAEAKTGEWNGEPIQSANIYLKDGTDAYLLDFRYNIINKSIINSLLHIDDYSKPVEISLYVNKRGYASASVRAGGELVDWKYGLSDLPQAKVVQFKGKDMRDFTEVDEFFHNQVKELAEKLNNGKNSGNDEGTKEQGASPEVEDTSDGDEEPLF